jgi:hypothetical protein
LNIFTLLSCWLIIIAVLIFLIHLYLDFLDFLIWNFYLIDNLLFSNPCWSRNLIWRCLNVLFILFISKGFFGLSCSFSFDWFYIFFNWFLNFSIYFYVGLINSILLFPFLVIYIVLLEFYFVMLFHFIFYFYW